MEGWRERKNKVENKLYHYREKQIRHEMKRE